MVPFFESKVVCGKTGGKSYAMATLKGVDGKCPDGTFDCGAASRTCVEGTSDELCPIISVRFDGAELPNYTHIDLGDHVLSYSKSIS